MDAEPTATIVVGVYPPCSQRPNSRPSESNRVGGCLSYYVSYCDGLCTVCYRRIEQRLRNEPREDLSPLKPVPRSAHLPPYATPDDVGSLAEPHALPVGHSGATRFMSARWYTALMLTVT